MFNFKGPARSKAKFHTLLIQPRVDETESFRQCFLIHLQHGQLTEWGPAGRRQSWSWASCCPQSPPSEPRRQGGWCRPWRCPPPPPQKWSTGSRRWSWCPGGSSTWRPGRPDPTSSCRHGDRQELRDADMQNSFFFLYLRGVQLEWESPAELCVAWHMVKKEMHLTPSRANFFSNTDGAAKTRRKTTNNVQR